MGVSPTMVIGRSMNFLFIPWIAQPQPSKIILISTQWSLILRICRRNKEISWWAKGTINIYRHKQCDMLPITMHLQRHKGITLANTMHGFNRKKQDRRSSCRVVSMIGSIITGCPHLKKWRTLRWMAKMDGIHWKMWSSLLLPVAFLNTNI